MTLTRYTDLHPRTQEQVRNRYVHWNHDSTVGSFAEWATEHAFYVRSDGALDERFQHCEPAFLAGPARS